MPTSGDLPAKNREVFAGLTELTDAFCDRHLNDEYKQLCREMALILCDNEPNIHKGKPSGWAAGIVSALGFVNFLSDPETKPCMRADDVALGFGISPATMHARSRVIREGFNLMQLHPAWCLPSLLDRNPLVWMVELNGLMVDMRSMPRKVQEAAYRQGLIPYVPNDPADEIAPLLNSAPGDEDRHQIQGTGGLTLYPRPDGES